MPAACPSDESLKAFANGRLAPAQREDIATHVRSCATCQAAFLPIALEISKLGATFLDSPRARERRTTDSDQPQVVVPPKQADGLEDTHVSAAHRGPAVATSLQTGDALDRYVILERLGAGGMGEVYTAWDPVLDRKVAVKILRDGTQDSKLGEELKARMLREAQALARLAHPNVVTIHDVGVMGEKVYLAMEFVEGQTLSAWLKKLPRTWRQVLEIFLAAGEGLAAAHEVGITHRDFKPDNVVVSHDGRARVMDFGLAHARAASPETRRDSSEGLKRAITDPGTMMGTPAYMSPEAMYGRPTDFRSDQFSFCVALYEALYKHRPFEGTATAAIAAEIEVDRVKPAPKDTKVPRRIHELLLRGLRRQPDQRFQTLRALLVQLGRRTGSRRRALLVLGLVCVGAVSVGVNAMLVRRDRQRCASVQARLDGVWDARSKTAIQHAFQASQRPWADAAWRDVERRLELYADRWVALRRAACEAQGSQASDEALGQNLVCLSRRFADLEAVSSLFVHADAEIVERAVATASALPALDECVAAAPGPALRPEREELRVALAAVKARIDAARYTEALSMARALSAKATALGERATLAEARIDEAVTLMRQGDPKGADALLEDALLTATQVGDDQLVARAWVERLGAAAIAEDPDAERWARFAEAALIRAPQAELEASLANNRGVLAWVAHRYEDAIAAHTRALELRRRLLGDKHVLVAKSHSNLGTAWKALGRFDAAVAEYELALEIEEFVLDPTHPAVAETLNNLGNALQARGDHSGARARLEKALQIKEGAFGEDALTVAVTLTNLGVLLTESNDLEGADRALTRALAIKEERAAAPSSLALTLTNLAKLRRDQQRWNEAVVLDSRALVLRQPRVTESAYNLAGLGRAKLELGDVNAARVHLEAALTLWPKGAAERTESTLLLARTVSKQEPALARRLLQSVIDSEVEGSRARADAQAMMRILKR